MKTFIKGLITGVDERTGIFTLVEITRVVPTIETIYGHSAMKSLILHNTVSQRGGSGITVGDLGAGSLIFNEYYNIPAYCDKVEIGGLATSFAIGGIIGPSDMSGEILTWIIDNDIEIEKLERKNYNNPTSLSFGSQNIGGSSSGLIGGAMSAGVSFTSSGTPVFPEFVTIQAGSGGADTGL